MNMDMEKTIKLSINPERVLSKEGGRNITTFKVREFNLDNPDTENELRELFQSNVHAVNYFTGGISNTATGDGFTGKLLKANYAGVFGIALDFDDGKLSLEEAKEQFKPYINIIYTSSEHRQDNPDHNGIQDRFRVILPFKPEPDGSAYFNGETTGDNFYSYLKNQFPDADPMVFGRHVKLFPFAGTDRDLYEFHLNKDADWYTVTNGDIEANKRIEKVKKRKKTSNKTFSTNETVILPDRKASVCAGDISEKQPCFCLFCNDLESKSASALALMLPAGYAVTMKYFSVEISMKI